MHWGRACKGNSREEFCGHRVDYEYSRKMRRFEILIRNVYACRSWKFMHVAVGGWKVQGKQEMESVSKWVGGLEYCLRVMKLS